MPVYSLDLYIVIASAGRDDNVRVRYHKPGRSACGGQSAGEIPDVVNDRQTRQHLFESPQLTLLGFAPHTRLHSKRTTSHHAAVPFVRRLRPRQRPSSSPLRRSACVQLDVSIRIIRNCHQAHFHQLFQRHEILECAQHVGDASQAAAVIVVVDRGFDRVAHHLRLRVPHRFAKLGLGKIDRCFHILIFRFWEYEINGSVFPGAQESTYGAHARSIHAAADGGLGSSIPAALPSRESRERRVS